MITRLRRSLVFWPLLAVIAVAQTDSAKTTFSSGEHRVALIELFTSEGCSSCPPADRWLGGLKDDPGLWKDFAPIALHVDYWNDLDWNDRFARGEYSERQRRYVAEGGARFAYTPGFFLDGQEWRQWRASGNESRNRSIAGELTIVVDEQHASVRFTTRREQRSPLTVQLALLGMNLETSVAAGENIGRTLRHDFVVLGVASASLDRVAGSYEAVMRLPATSVAHHELALVGWVSRAGSQAPIQAVGGYLPRPG